MPDFVYAPPMTPYLQLVYHDDTIVVANKPSGLLSVPGKQAIHKDSLILRLAHVWPQIRLVHRLDMATSGLIVFAHNKPAQGALSQQFANRQVSKRYRARVWGTLAENTGTVELPLRCDWPNRPKQMVCHEQGKSALTRYRVLSQQSSPVVTTDVALFPVTGRSHQLRVHMQSLGCPILGDRLYGTADSKAAAERLLLHAEYLAFTHPLSGQPLEFHCPAPFAEPETFLTTT